MNNWYLIGLVFKIVKQYGATGHFKIFFTKKLQVN